MQKLIQRVQSEKNVARKKEEESYSKFAKLARLKMDNNSEKAFMLSC